VNNIGAYKSGASYSAHFMGRLLLDFLTYLNSLKKLTGMKNTLAYSATMSVMNWKKFYEIDQSNAYFNI
jgi:hypothetical protein